MCRAEHPDTGDRGQRVAPRLPLNTPDMHVGWGFSDSYLGGARVTVVLLTPRKKTRNLGPRDRPHGNAKCLQIWDKDQLLVGAVFGHRIPSCPVLP